MSKKKKDRSQKKKTDANLFAKGWKDPQAKIDFNITNKLKSLSAQKDFLSIAKIAQNPLLPKMFIPVFPEENAHRIYDLGRYLSPEAYFHWVMGIFNVHINEISLFNSLREKINVALLGGDSDTALSYINEIENITFNWWSTETKLHITKEIKKGDTKQSIERLRTTFPKSGIANLISVLSESNSSEVFVSLIKEQLKEYRSSGLSDVIAYGAILSSKFLPLIDDRDRVLDFKSLYYFQTESIFDQYIVLQAIIYESYAKNVILDAGVRKKVLALAHLVGDISLINVLSPSDEIDPFVSNVLFDYTQGNYKSSWGSISSENSAKRFGLIDVYAKSKMHCGVKISGNLYDDLSDSLSRVLSLQPTCNEDIASLRKICTKFRNEDWAKSLQLHVDYILEEFNDPEGLEISRKQTAVLGKFNTPKAKIQNFEPGLASGHSSGSVPDERVIRHGSSNITSLELKRETFPIAADYLRTQAKFYIINSQELQAIDFAIDEYLRDKNSFIHLPIRRLCEIAVTHTRKNQTDYLSCIIILDIYGREHGGLFDEAKSEIFEDFLASCNTHKPSEIFKPSEFCPKVVYFLRQICTLSQLDNIIYFSNNDEVVHERVLILDLLIEAMGENQEAEVEILNIEKDKVVEALFADKLRAKIETGKLYVDVQALEAHRKHVYKSLFEQAKQIKGGVLLDPIDNQTVLNSSDVFQISNDGGDIPYVISSNDKTELVAKIYNQCVKDFALNEDYGLDKYLSAEIRHNVFVGQIRSCFEKLNLITEHSEEGYTTNAYWMQKYNYVSSSITRNVDEVLKIFSMNIDAILLQINDQFRVSVKLEDECIFNFATYYTRAQRVSTIVNSCNDFESFFRQLIEYMWDLSGDFAKSAQNIINEQLTLRIIGEIEKLERDISAVKGDVAMLNLMEEIKTARSDFSKEVELVLNWFRFVGSNDSQSYERLGVVVEATMSAFESIYGRKDLDLQFTQARSELLLNYRESRSLFISLFTGLQNASTYRSFGSAIKIEHTIVMQTDLITIKNSIDPKHEQSDPEGFILKQKAKWTDSKLKLSRAEGGSGLFKMNNFLKNSSAGFGFDIFIERGTFIASVSLCHEHFTDRR